MQSRILRFQTPAFSSPWLMAAILIVAVVTVGSTSFGHAEQLGLLKSERIAQVAEFLPPQPQGYGPPCSDRKSWQNLDVVRIAGNVVPRATALIDAAYPAWNDDAY